MLDMTDDVERLIEDELDALNVFWSWWQSRSACEGQSLFTGVDHHTRVVPGTC